MQKTILVLALGVLVLTGASCGQINPSGNDAQSIENTESSVSNLLTPNLGYIAEEAKEKLPSVKEARIYSEETDPNNLFGKPGYYIAGMAIWDTRSDYSEEFTPEEDKGKWGTGAGGSIEVYASEDDAKKRVDYLQQFVGNPLLDPGAFKQIKNVIIRASSELSKSQQDEIMLFFEGAIQK